MFAPKNRLTDIIVVKKKANQLLLICLLRRVIPIALAPMTYRLEICCAIAPNVIPTFYFC